MKEATGELNTTVIVVTAIALLSAFFFTVIWPSIKSGVENSTSCAKAICVCDNGDNKNCDGDGDGMVTCHAKGNTNKFFKCPYK